MSQVHLLHLLQGSFLADGERGDAVGFGFFFGKAMYEGEESLQRVGEYLKTMPRLAGMPDGEFTRFRGFAVKFLLRNVVLYRCTKTEMPLRRVMRNMKDKMEFLRQLYDELGHQGRDGTYEKLRLRYYWDGLDSDIDRYIRYCEESQKRKLHHYDEPLHPTFSVTAFAKVEWNVVHMPAVTDGLRNMVAVTGHQPSTRSLHPTHSLQAPIICP